jgi:alanine-synthesizing transaminase
VFVGNGVSELIDLSLRALLNPGDEVLLPSPDYPLWSAATILNDGRPVYYRCAPRQRLPARSRRDRAAGVVAHPRDRADQSEQPDRRDVLRARSSNASSRSPRSTPAADGGRDLRPSSLRRRTFQPLAPLAGDLPCLSFGGLSKVHRACGWRVGWAVLSGDPLASGDFHHAMDLLGALRLCANVPGQFAIDAALHGTDTISALTAPAAVCTTPAAH